jgi:hypothetical protein
MFVYEIFNFTFFYSALKLVVSIIDPIRSDILENKWVRYEFNFFDPNRVRLGSDQPDLTRLNIFFEVIL